MYISCSTIWDAGITKDKVSCCGSCHDDAEMFEGQYDLMEIYEEEIGLPRTKQYGEVVGSVCCAVKGYLETLPDSKELLRAIWDKPYE